MKRFVATIPLVLALLLLGIYIHGSSPPTDSPHSPSDPSSGASREIRDMVKPGETMFDIFQRNGLNIQELFRLKEATAGVHRLRDISMGQPYKIELGPDNSVLSLTYQINDDVLLNITRSDPGFRVEKIEIPYERRERKLGGIVESNLYEALGNSGDKAVLAYELSDIFSWDIDFTTDLRKGDAFRIVVEELWQDGSFRRYGKILAAEFINDGTTNRAFRYEWPDGRAGYYDEAGNSLQRSFLKAPLSYRRISSGFSYNRRHPILKIRRPHLGVDYVAPRGTPVSALGNGIVRFAGYKGANGNLVIIRHPKGFLTYYGHLHKIRSGIRPGVRILQGDVIGYVGSTGRATGPHLDFRMEKENRFVNPLRVNVPRLGGIPERWLADYDKVRHRLGSMLASITPAAEDAVQDSPERTVASSR